MREEVKVTTQQLHCERTGKHLLSVNQRGFVVWCKGCKTTHTIPKERILALWNEGTTVLPDMHIA